jgi:hypothetical protein
MGTGHQSKSGGSFMSCGSQEEHWRTFYESAWHERAQYINGLIEAGEHSIVRCINRLRAKERRFVLIAEEDCNGLTWRQKFDITATGYLPSGVPINTSRSLEGKPARIPFYTNPALTEFILDFYFESGPYDAIIELGSGLGASLFETYYAGLPADLPLFGGELTESGVALSRRLAALDAHLNAVFFHFDHLAADLSIIKERKFEKVLVYTSHSIEQVETVPLSFFREIAACAPSVTVLHLEPFGFQVRATTPSRVEQQQLFQQNRWNNNLVSALDEAVQEGICRKEWVSLDTFIPVDTCNSTSLLVWTNIPSETGSET